MGSLCARYWNPVYGYVRNRGFSPHDSEDLTQAFFARMIEKDGFRRADPERGKFRSFLLTALKNFLADQHDSLKTLKRGGGQVIVSMHAQQAEEAYQREPVDLQTPDRHFDKQWALLLIDRAMDRLSREFTETGKTALFEILQQFIVAGAEPCSFAEAGSQLGTTEQSVRKAVYRLRYRYRAIIREEISHTVGGEDGIEEELYYLWSCLG